MCHVDEAEGGNYTLLLFVLLYEVVVCGDEPIYDSLVYPIGLVDLCTIIVGSLLEVMATAAVEEPEEEARYVVVSIVRENFEIIVRDTCVPTEDHLVCERLTMKMFAS